MRCARETCGRRAPLRLFGRLPRGVQFEELWYCSVACVEAETRERLELAREPFVMAGRGQKASRLGALLVHQRAITMETLTAALREQRTSGLRLGAQLCAMGVISRAQVLRALATQAGVGYLTAVDPAMVHGGPGGLSRDAVRALGVVPIEADDELRRLKVACPAPLPRLALAVLRELTGCAVDPLLVDDDIVSQLIKEYATTATRPPVNVTRTESLGEAAHHIAEAIRTGRARRVQPVRCDPWLWVRLEGDDDVREEVVIPAEAVRKERSWQAELTQH